MCGIAGFVNFNHEDLKDLGREMSDTLIHRGPDDRGFEYFENSTNTIGLAFRRLSIIDLSIAGHQPMYDESNGNWIVFNGEVYNFKEIKVELELLGVKFRTNSDTEVVLKSFSIWGSKAVNKFFGMFAFCIYLKSEEKIFIFRDRVGVKPLYFYWKDNHFMFASEIKAFHKYTNFNKQLNYNAIGQFLKYDYNIGATTVFEYVSRLLPGNFIELSLSTQNFKIESYWNSDDYYEKPEFDISYSDAKLKLEELLISAFNYRMISDVPIGVFLSGGYDSSAVAAILQATNKDKIKTFTIGFEQSEYNEAPYAKAIAEHLGTSHSELYCTFKEAQDLISIISNVYDEPFGDMSAVPTMLVSKIAKQEVTVALSADGGDELFAGYKRHLNSFNRIKKIETNHNYLSFFSPIINLFQSKSIVNSNKWNKLYDALKERRNDEYLFGLINETLSTVEVNQLMNKNVERSLTAFDRTLLFQGEPSLIKRILATEFKTYLTDDILQKVDRASMAVGLEGREPFLDHRIIEFVAQLPTEYYFQNGTQKIILKDIVHKYIPKALIDRPKMGFGVPLEQWCKAELKDLFYTTIIEGKATQTGLVDKKEILNCLNHYFSNKEINFQKIWNIFILNQWYNKWM